MVRALAGGTWLVLVLTAAPGCERGGPGTAAPGGQDAAGEGAAVAKSTRPGDGASRADALGPTEQWMELRARIDEARKGDTLTVDRCAAWADELVALHLRHGEPYVGARLEAAALLRSCGRHQAARALLDEALEAMPRWARAEALNTLGVLAHESGDDGAAIAHLHAALHADPALHEARNNLVRILMRIYEGGGSDFARDDIQRHLDAWLELAPDDPRVSVQRARFEMIRARREPANAQAARSEAKLELALLLRDELPSPVRAEAYVVWGQLVLDEGDEVSALRAFMQAHWLDPTSGSAALSLAAQRLRTRDPWGARELLETADVDPSEERTRLRLLAVALREIKHYDDAAEVYAQLLSAEPPDPLDLYNRALLERYRLDQEPAPDAEQLERVREQFGEVIAATGGASKHAEIERRAKADVQALDERLAVLRQPAVPDAGPEDAELDHEERERKRGRQTRKRNMELESRAREARERRRFGGPAQR